jgi:hypothetical protein
MPTGTKGARSNGFFADKASKKLASYILDVKERGVPIVTEELLAVILAQVGMGLERMEVWGKNDRKLIAILEELVAQDPESFDKDYVKRIYNLLNGFTEEKLASLAERIANANSRLNLPAQRQMEIAKRMFNDLFQLNNMEVSSILAHGIQEMVMEAGMDPLLYNQLMSKLAGDPVTTEIAAEELVGSATVTYEQRPIRPLKRAIVPSDDLIDDSTVFE